MRKTGLYGKLFLALIIIAGIFSSCEKVVVLDLKNSPSEVVVQANVTNQPGPYYVVLNYSVPYYNSNTFPPVTGAQVKIYDNAGNSEILTETTIQGIYKTSSLNGTPGRTYTIQIIANSTSYQGVSTMPLPIPIDSFNVTHIVNINRFNNTSTTGTTPDTTFRLVCKFTDPSGVGNFYRLILSSKDTTGISDSTKLISDKLVDGQQISTTFRTKYVFGDTVRIKLESIDQLTYDFYNTIGGAIGSSSASQLLAAPPANPTNNISNNGLGYFAAYSITTATVIVR